jgi:hypothetical protein
MEPRAHRYKLREPKLLRTRLLQSVPERLEEYQALAEATTKVKTLHLRGFHGASGTRTRALLGAI